VEKRMFAKRGRNRGVMKEFDYRDREELHNIKMKLRKNRKRNKEQSRNIDTN